jgi:polysaccharide pyruvyl transferase WcaK-like protein
MEIMKQSDSIAADYVAAYADHAGGVELLARAEAVVAERLHAAVIAAACGTPSVAIEYRPKIRDFARSVNQEDYVLRSDEISAARLSELLNELVDEGFTSRLGPAVSSYRAKQKQLGVILSGLLRN